MKEAEKEIVEMLEKYKSFILCSDDTKGSCPDENDDSDCYDCDKNALDQATIEIMDIMEKENILLKVTISRQRQTIVDLENPGTYTSTNTGEEL